MQERAATRKAVTSDVEHSMVLSRKAVQHGERLREMGKAEKEEMKTERHLSYNQKVSESSTNLYTPMQDINLSARGAESMGATPEQHRHHQ